MEAEFGTDSHKIIADRKRAELFRKSIHFLIALVPALAAFNKTFTLALLAAGTLAYAVMEYLRHKGINIPLVSRLTVAASRRRDMGRFVLGPVTLGAGAFLTLLIFPPPAASIAILALAFGDGTASLAGKFFGRVRPPFLFGKSVEGSAACFLSVFISAWLYTTVSGSGGFPVVLAAALSATVTEVIPLRDWDNIIIPLTTGLAVQFFF